MWYEFSIYFFSEKKNWEYFLQTSILYQGKADYTEENINLAHTSYDFTEKFLANADYLVGSTLTLADIACITTISSIKSVVPIDADKYPKLSVWYDRVATVLPEFSEINEAGVLDLLKILNDRKEQNRQ